MDMVGDVGDWVCKHVVRACCECGNVGGACVRDVIEVCLRVSRVFQ